MLIIMQYPSFCFDCISLEFLLVDFVLHLNNICYVPDAVLIGLHTLILTTLQSVNVFF